MLWGKTGDEKESTMKWIGSIVLTAWAAALPAAPPVRADGAKDLLDATGVRGGLVVHVGCGDGKRTAALGASQSCVVHGLDADADNVAKARKHIEARGLCGRVSVDVWRSGRLPYVDNLVRLLVAEDLGKVGADEVMRVLCPDGVAYVKRGGEWKLTRKPRPKDIDEWTHYLHSAGGNAVADDAQVGPPRQLQWRAGPTFARHHDTLASVAALVSSGGRVFYLIDEGPASLVRYPAVWKLVARDAFNGVLLWKRGVASWDSHLRPFRSGPPQSPRRLVAVGDRVYVTLGLRSPVSVLDAATGRTVKTHKDTAGTDEILLHDGVLVLAVGGSEAGSRRSMLAVDADSGAVLWRKSGDETADLAPMGLAAAGGRVVYLCGRQVRCAELKTGRAVWRGASAKAAKAQPTKPRRRRAGGGAYSAPTLVVCADRGVVLSADQGKLVAMSLADGRVLWSCPCKPDFHAPADVFLADGLVWAGLFATEGRDPKTGQVKRKLDITGLLTGGHHPRCYRNKATNRYIISDKRGAEFFDLRGDGHARHNWARGSCQYGLMPCNGLLYLPPNACCCYAGAMLHGFYALRSAGKPPASTDVHQRLERGPAYAEISSRRAGIKSQISEGDWPTFRRDAFRSGSTAAAPAAELTKLWDTKVGGKLRQPVVAGGKLIVPSEHAGRVTALDAATGKTLWTFTAGGRVDSPPTVDGQRVLFGSGDGRVYCLRLADGRLAWRYLIAPEVRLTVADDQIESLWPARGSVLVLDGVAYAAAGRSCYLDGGLVLCGLDVATGKRLHAARVAIPHDKDESRAFVMAGSRADVLVTDGKYIYLQQLKFDKRLVRQKGFGRHVMCHSGLTDDTWFYRTFWRLGYGDAYDFPNSYIKHDLQVPFGQLLVFDDRTVCGLQTHFSPGISPGTSAAGGKGCLLFGDANRPFTPDQASGPGRDYPPRMKRLKTPKAHKWTAKLPFQARAMVLAGGKLFVAGWPDETIEANASSRGGGVLAVFSADDGKKIAERKLDAPPVFDGLIAAGGRLYVSTRDGRVVCFGKERP